MELRMELISFRCLRFITVRSDTETDTGGDEGRGSNPVAVYETDVTTDEKGDDSEEGSFIVKD